MPWFKTEEILEEWVRLLVPNGRIDVWVPDGLKICKVIVDQSTGVNNEDYLDGWRVRNPRGDAFVWASGRLLYGANDLYPSWHKAVFTATYLERLFALVGLTEIRRLEDSEFPGNATNVSINLGITGTKP